MIKFILSLVMGLFMTSLPETSFAGDMSGENKSLQKTHVSIVKDYRTIRHIDVSSAAELNKDDALFYDVRQGKEYTISHIPGAAHVEPDLSASDFMARFDQNWSGKTIIFYGSVGRRSSLLARKVQAELKAAGAKDVFNLKEGVFGWHNANLPLENANGPTEYIHPYTAFGSRMVNRKDLVVYK